MSTISPDGERGFHGDAHVTYYESQMDFFETLAQWEKQYAKVSVPNTDQDMFVKMYELGGVCERTPHFLLSHNKVQFNLFFNLFFIIIYFLLLFDFVLGDIAGYSVQEMGWFLLEA